MSILRQSILDIPVAQMTYSDVLRQIEEWNKEATNAGAHSIVAANVHVITEAALSPEFKHALLDADLVVPDGMPLVWASRILGSKLTDRCYGPALMAKALESLRPGDVSHFFYGSTCDTLDALLRATATKWPGTLVAGTKSPPFGDFSDNAEMASIEAINRSGAKILWLGMGCPKQELWMCRYRRHLTCKTVLGVGAAFDFIAGVRPQAPSWMQNAGMEWLFRLFTEPKRLWKRYLFRNPYFIMLFTRQLLNRKLNTSNER